MGHHPLAIFSLVPKSERAKAIVNDRKNERFASVLLDKAGNPVKALDIGFRVGSSSPYTLATLGRCGADITIEGPSISRIQCSFELHQTSGMVMLYDRSNSQTTHVLARMSNLFCQDVRDELYSQEKSIRSSELAVIKGTFIFVWCGIPQ